MVKKIDGTWKCRNCGAVLPGSEWMTREISSDLFGRASYSCPRCFERVELKRV